MNGATRRLARWCLGAALAAGACVGAASAQPPLGSVVQIEPDPIAPKKGDGVAPDAKDDIEPDIKPEKDKKNGNGNGTAPAKAAYLDGVTILALPECQSIALERQPRIRAFAASAHSAEISLAALQNQGRLAKVLAPDLDIRRCQAARGVAIAHANLTQATVDVTYAVTRNYYSLVYARQQQAVIRQTLAELDKLIKPISEAVEEEGGKIGNLTTEAVLRLKIIRAAIATREVEADTGVSRSYAALREAMGVGDTLAFQPLDLALPDVRPTLDRDALVAMALGRRGEVISAGIATDVFRLEIEAQGKYRFRPTVRTFASGADIHAQPVQSGDRGVVYRPDAVGVEMPVQMVGDRDERMARAGALSARTDAVYENTRNLVTLEAQNAYFLAIDAERKLATTKAADEAASELQKRARRAAEQFRTAEDPALSLVIVGQARASYAEASYQYVLALAQLERVTAGGFQAGFPGR